jgi:hypothetical protein
MIRRTKSVLPDAQLDPAVEDDPYIVALVYTGASEYTLGIARSVVRRQLDLAESSAS